MNMRLRAALLGGLAVLATGPAGASTINGKEITDPQAMLMTPSRPDLINAGTNNTEFASRFIVGNAGSVGTFGNTTSLGSFSGVGGLVFRTYSGGSSCTGALVSPTLVITAAHCFPTAGTIHTIEFGTPNLRPSSGVGNLVNPGPVQVVTAASYTINPGYNPALSVGGGNDIALIRLNAPVVGDVYEIYRGNAELFADHIKVGAGSSGWGLVGNDSTTTAINSVGRGNGFFDGRKRAGYNQYEAFAQPFFGAVLNDPLTWSGSIIGGPADGVLVYDYDSGSANNDAFGNLDLYSAGFARDYLRQQTGVFIGGQNWEVNASPGDSGGPTFLRDTDGVWRIAGITSFGITSAILDGGCGGYDQTTGAVTNLNVRTGRPNIDSSRLTANGNQSNSTVACGDSSWGEFAGDTRVSRFQNWYDVAVASQSSFTVVSEPGALGLLGFGVAGLIALRRRRAA
jgi:hypothetical protein